MGDKHGLSPALTVRTNLDWYQRMVSTRRDRALVERAAEILDIGELLDRPVGTLSTGQAQRSGLARLFVASHDLWLLDEPLSHLDADRAAALVRQADEHVKQGGAAVLATHQSLPIATTREVHLPATG